MAEKWNFPVSTLAVAYVGAHANQYAMNMSEWFPGSDWKESFRYAMEKGVETIKRQVLDLPEIMTLKEIVDRALT